MTIIIQSPLSEHPSVRALSTRAPAPAPAPLTLEAVRRLARLAGADDCGVAALEHPELAEERGPVRRAFPAAKTLVSLVVKMHPENVRSPARSVANQEFHHAADVMNDAARALVASLAELGHRALNPAMAFPMEMDDFPGRTWIVSHKRVAVAAQLGRMGLHRNVIHPRFGSFIVLGTVLLASEVVGTPEPLTFDPCVSCKLCVAACPVGAIEPGGAFRFSACYDHNYREFMTGFGDLLEDVAESRDKHALREKLSISESASMWQSLAYKPNYKAAHCVAVCPAGEDVLAPFLADRPGFLREVVKPLTTRTEPVYVVAGSDAEAHVTQRFPHKPVRRVRSSLRSTTVDGFFRAIPHVFQRGPARGWSATFHFDLDGRRATVRIADGTIDVRPDLEGTPDVLISGDGQTWLDVVSGKRNAVLAVLKRKLRVVGDRALVARFAKCFPR
jgi:NAD-dependent dihydropyrimidine dehydrogenase PreA subunit